MEIIFPSHIGMGLAQAGLSSRRRILRLALLAVVFVIVLAGQILADVVNISPTEARQRALDGELILIDVRTPKEWAASGLPDVAIGLDLRRRDFVKKLRELEARIDGLPIAYICSASGRSSGVTYNLDRAGFKNVINVTEGVFGNSTGPGWIKRGLPMRDAGTTPHPSVDTSVLPEF